MVMNYLVRDTFEIGGSTHPPTQGCFDSGGHPQTPVRGGRPPLNSPRAVQVHFVDDHEPFPTLRISRRRRRRYSRALNRVQAATGYAETWAGTLVALGVPL